MYGYNVKINSYCTHAEYSPEQYGDWEENWDNSFVEIRKVPQDKYADIFSPIDFKPGDDVFVVWLDWDEGDSFGWGTRKGHDALAVFSTYEDANGFAEKVIADAKKGFSVGPLEYESKDGQRVSVYTGSWTGYFERLHDVFIEEAVMGREKDDQ